MELTGLQLVQVLLEIIWINILLSGDNAVVIAMACRGLPGERRRAGMILGSAVAVLLRIVFTVAIAELLSTPFLKIVGSALLLWIAVKLLTEDDDSHGKIRETEKLWHAVRTIAVADAVMSLDNVLAIAAAARGSTALLVVGLAISIPLIVAGAALIMALLERLPLLVWAGAALLGWIAGDMLTSDPALIEGLGEVNAHRLELPASLLGAGAVVTLGFLLNRGSAAGSA
jgi:YjbE family integral membrane protein